MELYNPSLDTERLQTLMLSDSYDGGTDALALASGECPAFLSGRSFLVLCRRGAAHIFEPVPAYGSTQEEDAAGVEEWARISSHMGCGFEFGIGGGDDIYLLGSDGRDLIDSTGGGCCAGTRATSFGRRNPGRSEAFGVLLTRTLGSPNVVPLPPPAPPPSLPPSLPPSAAPEQPPGILHSACNLASAVCTLRPEAAHKRCVCQYVWDRSGQTACPTRVQLTCESDQ